MLSSYDKGYYNYYDVERIEEFVAYKGAYEIASFLQNVDHAPYEYENLAILKYCYDNYKDDSAYITEYLKGLLIRPKHIYNFLLFHATFMPLTLVLY